MIIDLFRSCLKTQTIVKSEELKLVWMLQIQIYRNPGKLTKKYGTHNKGMSHSFNIQSLSQIIIFFFLICFSTHYSQNSKLLMQEN